MKRTNVKAKKVVVVENNATGQLDYIMKMNVGMAEKIVHTCKYDGNPFLPYEVYNQCKELLITWQHLKIFETK